MTHSNYGIGASLCIEQKNLLTILKTPVSASQGMLLTSSQPDMEGIWEKGFCAYGKESSCRLLGWT